MNDIMNFLQEEIIENDLKIKKTLKILNRLFRISTKTKCKLSTDKINSLSSELNKFYTISRYLIKKKSVLELDKYNSMREMIEEEFNKLKGEWCYGQR